MNSRFLASLCIVPIALPIGVLALRHHVPVALSYVAGPEIMTTAKLVVAATPANDGVPPYVLSEDEFEGTFALTAGDSFTVTTRRVAADSTARQSSDDDDERRGRGRGRGGDDDCDDDRRGRNREESHRVTFRRSQFQDMAHATADEIVDAINSQLPNAEAYEDNGHLVVVAERVGARAEIELQNRRGAPLEAILLPVGPTRGEAALTLTLSVPLADDPTTQFAGFRYRIVASTTAGDGSVDGLATPIVADATTTAFDTLVGSGQLPGFSGSLDANDDAVATLPPAAVRAAFGATLPPALYLTFVVYDGDDQAVYASNLFTVELAR